MILIDALYLNSFGGKVLLELLVDAIFDSGEVENYYFFLDKRLNSNCLTNIPNQNKTILITNLRSRKIEYKKVLYEKNITSILCFANVPPPISIKNIHVYIYFHNTLLLNTRSSNYSYFNRLKFKIKSYYIRLHNRQNYFWIVQSDLIKSLLIKSYCINVYKILILPFFNENIIIKDVIRKKSYIYVADGVPQKNHLILLLAWESLFNDYCLSPTLMLTFNEETCPILKNEILRLQRKGLRINNRGILEKEELMRMYQENEYLIFPSLSESFGLPMVEACLMGCKVLASNLPFVHQIIEASALFDPNDKNEIVSLIHNLELENLLLPPTTLKIKNKVVDILKLLK